MSAISLQEILHNRPEVVPTIYAYEATNMPDHIGYIKIGYTDRPDYESRIKEQTHTAGVKYRILKLSDNVPIASAVRSDGTCFTDNDVHNVLKRKHFKQLYPLDDNNEWYKCSIDDVKTAIEEVRTGIKSDDLRSWNFPMRKEQRLAVDMTEAYFIQSRLEDPTRSPKFLWNAKMRFGKTFAAYQLSKRLGFKKILVLTFKPVVESAWWEDLSRHIDFKGWQFVSNKEAKYDSQQLDAMYDNCDKSQPIVVFGSFQDLLGTNENGGIKAKNEFIHEVNWDIVIFDEYHFGAWRENAKNLFEKYDEENTDFDIEKYQREEAGNAINESFLPISSKHYLYLSGTPFRALGTGEFLEDQIFNWTYSDEQREKLLWKGPEPNPYASLPKMVMLTYKVPDSITQVAINEGFDGFDINEFFKAEPTEKNKPETSRFIYEDYVQKWLELIQGKYMAVDGLKLGTDKPPMPFSDTTLLNVLSHTLWFLPNVSSCFAMFNLLNQKQNAPTFGSYKIIVCAGAKAGIGIDALEPVLNAMDDPLKTRSITLSCGKLTTGVTVRPWSGVFMLRNLKSPETYFQTAFRVQSPWETIDDHGNKVIIKEECYIFDFALERALKQISDYSCNLNKNETSPESKVSEFINFLPVLAFDGSSMNQIDAQDILDITFAGTSATLLAKRWQTALLVHVDNESLKRLQNNPDALAALNNIEGFRNLNADISTIINRSDKVKKAKKEKGDKLTPKEKKELSEDEKQAKSLRKQVQENLLKLAARIPAFMYLTDYREQCIKDVITQLEPELFKSVTGLSVKDFDTLCSIGLFDSEKMNQGIFGFRKYENASLTYTGIDMHENEDIGGWDTVLKKDEYELLYSKQKDSILNNSIMELSEKEIKTAVEKQYFNDISNDRKSQTHTPLTSKPKEKTQEEKWLEILEHVNEGVIVTHSKFGEGTIIWMDKARKYIKVHFEEGEKQFTFPSSFTNGFLKLK